VKRPAHNLLPELVRGAAPVAVLLLAACASVPSNAGKNPRDPFERVNRQVFAFNEQFDHYVARPLARSYVAVVPKALRLCIDSGFTNLLEIRNAINDILQVKPVGAATDTGRLAINSTLGVFGCFDVATKMGLEYRSEDFGLTLARWGLGTGPYVVLPLLGPSDVRDAIGLVPDNYVNPVSYVTPMPDRYILIGMNLIDTRAELLDASALIEQAALDRYQFTRDAYFQRRLSKQYEGNPPPPREDDDSGDPPDPEPTGTKTRPAQPSPEDRR
jgi:phospholipid-binding lipoprotein MlaA